MPQTTRYAVIDTATDELVATYPAATDTEVRAAVDAAHRATS